MEQAAQQENALRRSFHQPMFRPFLMTFLKPAALFAAGALFCASALPLAAQSCPTKADLARGITVSDSRTKSASTFKIEGAKGYVLERRSGGTAGSEGRQITWYLNGMTPAATDRNGYETRFIYNRDNSAEIANLATRKTSALRFRVVHRGAEIDKGTVRYRAEGTGHITLSGCRYRVVMIRTDTKLASGAQYIWRQYYAPALDISLRAEKLGKSGRALSAVRFDTIRKN